ncbi:adenylate kinase [Aliikangiella maris]|uniref:Adenylate kinase n=2 Tax=Aliikangiella maris TaxID=3162458 RepID=A0ABV2BX91_9GAMM
MNKIMVFGKPGGGKSTLSKKLSLHTGIKFHSLDLIEYSQNGQRVSTDAYHDKHQQLISGDNWIIDGFGTIDSFWQRIDAADTLIYIDLPYFIHYWWVGKRLLKSLRMKPEGWPEGSSMIKGTLASWKFLRLSPKFWNSDLMNSIRERAKNKTVYHHYFFYGLFKNSWLLSE